MYGAKPLAKQIHPERFKSHREFSDYIKNKGVIAGVDLDPNELLIWFHDKEFMYFKVDGWSLIVDRRPEIDLLLRCDLIDKEESAEIERAEESEAKERRRTDYERLKKEFG